MGGNCRLRLSVLLLLLLIGVVVIVFRRLFIEQYNMLGLRTQVKFEKIIKLVVSMKLYSSVKMIAIVQVLSHSACFRVAISVNVPDFLIAL